MLHFAMIDISVIVNVLVSCVTATTICADSCLVGLVLGFILLSFPVSEQLRYLNRYITSTIYGVCKFKLALKFRVFRLKMGKITPAGEIVDLKSPHAKVL